MVTFEGGGSVKMGITGTGAEEDEVGMVEDIDGE